MKALYIRLLELVLLISLYLYVFVFMQGGTSSFLQYSIIFAMIILITDISASLFSQKSILSSYLSEPKTRVFYISCGLLLSIPTAYAIILWYITARLGGDTSILFWKYLIPTNAILVVSMLLVLTLIYFNNPNRSKKQFVPMIAGFIVSMPWWYVIYQKCMDRSILLTANSLDLLKYFFYMGTAVMIVFVTVVATLYVSLRSTKFAKIA